VGGGEREGRSHTGRVDPRRGPEVKRPRRRAIGVEAAGPRGRPREAQRSVTRSAREPPLELEPLRRGLEALVSPPPADAAAARPPRGGGGGRRAGARGGGPPRPRPPARAAGGGGAGAARRSTRVRARRRGPPARKETAAAARARPQPTLATPRGVPRRTLAAF